MSYAAQFDGSGGYLDPISADGYVSGISDTGMGRLHPIYLRESLIAGESGGLPGFESTSAAVSKGAPVSSIVSEWWDNIKNDMNQVVNVVETETKNAYGGIKDLTKTVYNDVSSGVGEVFDDVTHPVETALSGLYWYAIVGVIVIAGAVYFMGKGGAIKVHAIV